MSLYVGCVIDSGIALRRGYHRAIWLAQLARRQRKMSENEYTTDRTIILGLVLCIGIAHMSCVTFKADTRWYPHQNGACNPYDTVIASRNAFVFRRWHQMTKANVPRLGYSRTPATL